jgi:hypothetical protein
VSTKAFLKNLSDITSGKFRTAGLL